MRGNSPVRSIHPTHRRESRGGTLVGWLIMLMGLALAGGAGVLLGITAGGGDRGLIPAGIVMLALGAVMAVAGVSGNTRLVRLRLEAETLAKHPGMPLVPVDPLRPPGALPPLGQLLVHKYHLISERDLARGLARQQETGKQLGRTLVEMELVEWTDLVKVLEDQMSYGDPWRRNRPRKRLVAQVRNRE